jgi:sulfate transport system substrate-binding protein
VAKHYYRPSDPTLAGPDAAKQFPELTLFTVKDVFGSWREAHEKHFKDGGVFDSIYVPK